MQKFRCFFVSLLAIIGLCQLTQAARTISSADLADKARGMWLGQMIGNQAGRSTEGQYQTVPNPASSVPWVIKEIWDGDDDTDIEYLALHILEENGFECLNEQIAAQWLHHVTLSGIYIANRQAWYLMGDGLLPPLTGSRAYNEHWYSIDAQITTEVMGAISPGLFQSAINQTGKFARITNEGFPVHAAQLYAAMYANAFFQSDVLSLVQEGLNAIPTTSRTYKVVSDVLNWYLDDAEDLELNWRSTRQKLYDHYQGAMSQGRYYYWIESTVNVGATVLAILYGQGDFKQTVQIGVLAGWDCDCNPAHAGGLLGIILGYSGLPSDLTNPVICGDTYQNVYRPYLPDPNLTIPQYESITNIADRIVNLAEQNILAQDGYITYGPDKTYHIPDTQPVISDPEKPDPNGPTGLVATAMAEGIIVTTSAAVEYHVYDTDRRNLDAIIDGIVDNSYNGHKAYYSYLSDPFQRPEQDWYQINFSQPVKFDTLVFYEGDIVWSGINTYVRDDESRGGFFNDLNVEILRDGQLINPANLQITPELSRLEMYQTLELSFSPTVGEAIRIVGTPGGTQGFTTIMELEIHGEVDPGLYVASISIAEDQIQRSDVTQIAIRFNHDVNIALNDIELTGIINGTTLDEGGFELMYNSELRELILKFDIDGNGMFGDSLPDDVYQLKLNCSSITTTDGLRLLDDDSDPSDGHYTITFHRLFGDSDGSGTVDFADLLLLSSIWLYPVDNLGLDIDHNGQLTLTDFAAFGRNWQIHISP